MNTETTQPRRNRWQISLRHLMLWAAVVAIATVPIRVTGWASVHFLAAAAVFALPFVWRPRWLYTWILPLVWMPTAIRNFEHCGDEYAGFVVGSLAGLWVSPVFSLVDASNPKEMLPWIVAAGVVSLAAAGWLLDRLRWYWLAWYCLWLGIAVWAFVSWIQAFPTVERALGKNGSYDTYIVTATNFGLTAATVVSLMFAIVWRSGLWFWRLRSASK